MSAPTANRTFNRLGFRRQSRAINVAVYQRAVARDKAAAEAKARGEFICTGCYSSILIGTHTCHCGRYVATVIGNRVEVAK